MALTAVVATVGRPTLERTVTSVERCFPGATILLMPSPESYSDVRRRLGGHVFGQPTSGLYPAWNAAINLIESSHCILVNDDDYLEGTPLFTDVLPSLASDELISLPFIRDGEGRSKISLTRMLRRSSPMLIDILRATRLVINSVLWPVGLFDEVGGFSSQYRVSGDLEWMQRLSDLRFRFTWAKGPRYIQSRGAERLSSPLGSNRNLMLAEGAQLCEYIKTHRGARSLDALVMRAWLWNLGRTLGSGQSPGNTDRARRDS